MKMMEFWIMKALRNWDDDGTFDEGRLSGNRRELTDCTRRDHNETDRQADKQTEQYTKGDRVIFTSR